MTAGPRGRFVATCHTMGMPSMPSEPETARAMMLTERARMSEKNPPEPIDIDNEEERGELSEEGFGNYDKERNPIPPLTTDEEERNEDDE